MKDEFKTIEEKEKFQCWFFSALEHVEIINRLRDVRVCPICNEYVTLASTGKKISAYKFRIPNGLTDLVVDSSILHLVSVHNLVPDRSIIEALEKIKPRSSDS